MTVTACRERRASVLSGLLYFNDSGKLTHLKNLLGGGGRKQMHGAGDYPGPSGLVARSYARPIVRVKVFVKQDEIAPVRVFLKFFGSPIHRPFAIFVTQEDIG